MFGTTIGLLSFSLDTVLKGVKSATKVPISASWTLTPSTVHWYLTTLPGAFGTVYLAKRLSDDREVILKQIPGEYHNYSGSTWNSTESWAGLSRSAAEIQKYIYKKFPKYEYFTRRNVNLNLF